MLLFWTLSNPQEVFLLAGVVVAFGLMLGLSRTTPKCPDSSFASQAWSFFLKPWEMIQSRITAWAFLLNGRNMMRDAYRKASFLHHRMCMLIMLTVYHDQSQGAPFSLDVPENRYWVVSSRDQIKEMDAAPQSVLSLLGAAKDLLQPKHTMRGFNWMEDKQGTEGATLIKTLRNDLTNHLSEVLPEIRLSMGALFDQNYDSLSTINGAKISPILSLVSRAIAQSNAFIFFSEELSQNTEFIKAGISMVEHTLIISDVIRLLPKPVSDPVGKFLAGRLNSGNIVYDALEPMVARRFEEQARGKQGHQVPEHRDCVQWIMDNSPKTKPWTVQRVVHELVALWYGSVHITSVSACFALLDLCHHKEYAEPLRREVENTGWEAFDKSGGRLFPLMDSFIKESARMNPVECMSTRRKALKPFHFADGTKVEPGQWVCSPLEAMNLDPKNYASPNEFHGFRFVEPDTLERSLATSPPHEFKIPKGQKPSQFTDMSDTPIWGAGKMTCGGRFYASSVIKTLLGLFLTKWDTELMDPNAKQYFAWRSWIYPYANAKAVLRPIKR
ncbi:putative Cytochrome P450 [Seiridium unicorne]|uniref:Cytochrome P450 n=1 Tax=Seiridium unicorne TaxID=138068 RepID=A0ABR2UXM7_9PEZI